MKIVSSHWNMKNLKNLTNFKSKWHGTGNEKHKRKKATDKYLTLKRVKTWRQSMLKRKFHIRKKTLVSVAVCCTIAVLSCRYIPVSGLNLEMHGQKYPHVLYSDLDQWYIGQKQCRVFIFSVLISIDFAKSLKLSEVLTRKSQKFSFVLVVLFWFILTSTGERTMRTQGHIRMTLVGFSVKLFSNSLDPICGLWKKVKSVAGLYWEIQ